MKYRAITIRCYVPDAATDADLSSFLLDLEWVGGCRDPDRDPLFESIRIKEVKIRKTWYVNEGFEAPT